jgi:hypothetical protein
METAGIVVPPINTLTLIVVEDYIARKHLFHVVYLPLFGLLGFIV